MSSSSEESYDESEIWSIKPKKTHNSLEKQTEIADKVIKQRDDELEKISEAREAKRKIWKEKKEKRKEIRQNLKTKRIEKSVIDSASTSNKEEWIKEIKPLLTINDHLQGPVDHGKYGPKTEVEVMIDQAIEEGDFGKAEQLSDHLADRKFAVKIANAFEARRYLKKKTEIDAVKKAKKRKKLYWGFEVKQKWQMKANM